MFVNFSNHPSDRWDISQYNAAVKYGEIVDVPFPEVSPEEDEAYIDRLIDESVTKITSAGDTLEAVMVQGEYNLTYGVVNRLLALGIKVLSACTQRNVIESVDETGNITKESRFCFVRFREYRG